MPRVKPEYFESKKALIVNAALEVCKRKTISSITMQDIIDETGLSQGGIYRFYKNIDEILVQVLNRIRTEQDTYERMMQMYAIRAEELENARRIENEEEARQSRRKVLVSIIKDYMMILAESMEKYLYPHTKIEMEFLMLAHDYPERAGRIFNNVVPYKSAYPQLYKEVMRECEDGCLLPKVSIDEFFSYHSAVYQGIIKKAISKTCYEKNAKHNEQYIYDFKSRTTTMFYSCCFFLGLEGELEEQDRMD